MSDSVFSDVDSVLGGGTTSVLAATPSSTPGVQLPDYAKPGPYVTKLSTQDEAAFQGWVKQNKVPWQDIPNADYDMRGFYKALTSGDPRAKQKKSEYDQHMHFPDVWKTPYHKTFSNESIYAKKHAPHWEGDKLIDSKGNVIADETPK
jgi:hypothetical protein